ncbi:MAG: alpha/beta fold hydrolase [Novosphingobium sp.]|nr:alpha/beta fold hydrolase [Novosphingobium sp.]
MQVRRFARADGGVTVADVGGDAGDPGVLVIHGAGESRHAHARLARGLVRAGRFVVSVDLRGHGESDDARDGDYGLAAMLDDLRRIVEELDCPMAVVGQRLGGLLGVSLAARLGSDRIPALVALDASPCAGGDLLSDARHPLAAAKEGFADLAEAQRRLGGMRPSLAREALLRRVMRQRDDGRWQWRFDPRFITGPEERRVDLARDGQELSEDFAVLAVPSLFLRTEDRSLLDPAEAARLQAMNGLARTRDLVGQRGGPVDPDRLLAEVIGVLEAHMRRDPARPLSGAVDPLTLRQALGCFATGVTILTTTAKDGTPVGLTANSFCSVSLDPPLILFCIDRKVSTLPVFEEADSFAVNVLHIGQQDLSDQFVRKGIDRFAGTGWERWESLAPIVQDSMASIECEKHQVLDGGDHRIFIGRVREVLFDPSRDPLLFFQGKYRRVHVPH